MSEFKHLEEMSPGRWRARIIRGGELHSTPVMSLDAALAARDKMLEQLDQPKNGNAPVVTGITVDEIFSEEAEEEILHRAIESFDKEAVRQVREDNQVIRFPGDEVVGVVFTGDTHIGNKGTDYERLFYEMQLVADTPGVYLWLMGDIADAFIVKGLHHARFEAPITIQEEWALVRRFLRIVGPKVLGVNSTPDHDGWVDLLTGIPYFREVMERFAPQALYGKHRVKVRFEFGDWHLNIKMRHKWRGHSQWNFTHAIEKAAHFDKDFDIGVGGHTHVGCYSRDFSVGTRDCLALQVGPYKRYDDYAEKLGLPPHNSATSGLIIFDPFDRAFTGYRFLEHGLKVLRSLRGDTPTRKDRQ